MKTFWVRAVNLVLIAALVIGYNTVLTLRDKDDQIAKLTAELESANLYKQAVLRKHGIYVFFTGALPAVCSLPEVCARPCLGLVAVVFEGRLKRPRHFLCHKLPFCLFVCRYFLP